MGEVAKTRPSRKGRARKIWRISPAPAASFIALGWHPRRQRLNHKGRRFHCRTKSTRTAQQQPSTLGRNNISPLNQWGCLSSHAEITKEEKKRRSSWSESSQLGSGPERSLSAIHAPSPSPTSLDGLSQHATDSLPAMVAFSASYGLLAADCERPSTGRFVVRDGRRDVHCSAVR